MADTLRIVDLAVECRLGVEDWERQTPQMVWIDLELAIEAARAARRDDIEQAIDYARLVNVVKACAQKQPYRLLETLAEAIADVILDGFATDQVRVQVKKRALPGIGYAAVEVERVRRRGALRPLAARRSPERARRV